MTFFLFFFPGLLKCLQNHRPFPLAHISTTPRALKFQSCLINKKNLENYG